jgi:dTDP-4-dehydrorhamnose reductase
VSWFEFVRAIVDEMGADVGKVRGIPTSELQPPRPAPRPANSVLDNWVLRSSGLPLLRDFHAPLGELVRLLLE